MNQKTNNHESVSMSNYKTINIINVYLLSGIFNKDNFLNQITMAVARATVFYCIILCGRRKESAAVVCVIMTQQHRRKRTQQRRQYNKIAEAVTHKSIQYNK